jgi:hypothetical protein
MNLVEVGQSAGSTAQQRLGAVLFLFGVWVDPPPGYLGQGRHILQVCLARKIQSAIQVQASLGDADQPEWFTA